MAVLLYHVLLNCLDCHAEAECPFTAASRFCWMTALRPLAGISGPLCLSFQHEDALANWGYKPDIGADSRVQCAKQPD